jgi:hypothetical protein
MAREDRAARVAKGRRGAAIDVFRAGESPFSADHLCSNDFKDDQTCLRSLIAVVDGVRNEGEK